MHLHRKYSLIHPGTFLALVFCFSGLFTKAQSADRYLQLADSIYYSDPDSSYALCACAGRAADKKDLDKRAEVRLCQVRYLLLKSRYEEVSTELGKAIAQFKTSGNKNNLARAYNSKSILLERLGDNDGKYNYQNEAVRLYEETGNINGQVKMLSNLSLSYTYDKRFKEAAECLDKILMQIDKLKQTDVYYYYQNRGIYHKYKGEYDKAVVNLEAALGIAREQKMVDSEITALTRLGESQTELKKYAAAQTLLEEAEKLAKTHHLNYELDEVYSALIRLYTVQEKYRQAFETLTLQNQAHEKADHLQSIHHIRDQDKKDDLSAELKARLKALNKESHQLNEEVIGLRSCKWILLGAAVLFLLVLAWAVYTIMRLKRKLKAQREVLERLYRK